MREQSRLWLAVPVLCGVCVASLETTRGHAAQLFIRGDVDESGRLTISDAVRIFQFLFQGVQEAVGCEKAADADDDGTLTITDGIFMLNFLFKGGNPPKAPFTRCGLDPTEDALGCNTYDSCLKSFHFYGVEFSAGAVFYVVDRSEVMVDREELPIAKDEVTQSIAEFSAGVEFAVVFFSWEIVKAPEWTPGGGHPRNQGECSQVRRVRSSWCRQLRGRGFDGCASVRRGVKG